jgi:hypothetical protein
MSMPASNSSFFKFGKKHGRETADKYAKRKNDEYLDDDLAKVLEEKEKLEYRRERDRQPKNDQMPSQKYSRANLEPDRLEVIEEDMFQEDEEAGGLVCFIFVYIKLIRTWISFTKPL